MKLRHATPARNLSAIQRTGLLTRKSQGKLPVIWLHSEAASGWAVLHTAFRHHVPAQAVVILEVSVPRRWLRRSRRRLWYCTRSIPPERIRGVIGFTQLAAAGAEK